jgi:peptidoglycan/xylan/chitin deacetylase (PgdA/CDA1 family)
MKLPMVEKDRITIFNRTTDPCLRYIATLIEDWLKMAIEVSDNVIEKYDLVYGDPVLPEDAAIPRVDHYADKNVPLAEDFLCGDNLAAKQFPFDLFSAMRFWILDEANKYARNGAFDEHERLIPMHSVQAKLDTVTNPPVNRYAILFKRWLKKVLAKDSNWVFPEEKKAAIILSHDVDAIDVNFASYRRFLANEHWGKKKPLNFMKALVQTLNSEIKNILSKEDYECFRKIMNVEEESGVHSTFFFSAYLNFEQRLGPNNVKYLIDTPEIRRTFEEMKERGFEIGLHSSYESGSSAALLKEEKERLEQVAGVECRGIRHHAWHIGNPPWETFQRQARAGLKYDSSFAFNDEPGYRLGIALPFHPWHDGNPLDIIEVPVGIMDGALFYQEGMNVDRAIAIISSAIDSLKIHEGVMAIDWHNYTSYPGNKQYRMWGDTYLELLKLLRSDRDLWVGSFQEFLAFTSSADDK